MENLNAAEKLSKILDLSIWQDGGPDDLRKRGLRRVVQRKDQNTGAERERVLRTLLWKYACEVLLGSRIQKWGLV